MKVYKDGRAEVASLTYGQNPSTIQVLEKIYNNLEEHGFALCIHQWRIWYERNNKRTKAFVTDDVNERKPTKAKKRKRKIWRVEKKKTFKKRYGKDAEAAYATATKMQKTKIRILVF